MSGLTEELIEMENEPWCTRCGAEFQGECVCEDLVPADVVAESRDQELNNRFRVEDQEFERHEAEAAAESEQETETTKED